MIRRPTPPEIAYAWHRQALKEWEDPAIRRKRGATYYDYQSAMNVGETPQCGWFKRKLVKGGPWVPARIYLRQEIDEAGELLDDEILLCDVNGVQRDPHDQWLWLCGNPISEEEYEHMCSVKTWAAYYSPNDPSVNAKQAIDWMTMEPPSFRKEASDD